MSKKQFPAYVSELEGILLKIFKNMKSQHVKDANELNLSLPQFFCIGLLFKCEKIKMSELAELMGLSYASATNLINRLVDAGLVNRYDSPEDRRVVMVNLSKKGKEVTEGIRKKRLARLAANCEKYLTKDEIETMVKGISLFAKMQAATEDE